MRKLYLVNVYIGPWPTVPACLRTEEGDLENLSRKSLVQPLDKDLMGAFQSGGELKTLKVYGW